MTPDLEREAALSEDGYAQVEPLPPQFADRILSSKWYRFVRNFTTIAPLIIVGIFGLLLFAGILHRRGIDDETPADVRTAKLLYCAGASAGCLTILFAQPERLLRRIAFREVCRRPGTCFDPRARNSRFVGLVPKSNWDDKTLMDKSVDVGFLAPCSEKGPLVFEGNTERYRIPREAIVKCELDSYSRTAYAGHGSTYLRFFYFVVVSARVSEKGTVELPFRIRSGLFGRSQQQEREVHYALLREINTLQRV